MNKRTRIILLVGVAAVAVYFLYRYIQNRGGTNSGTGALGSNLNSVAPELIGGSSGPSQGPAVSVPVSITVTSTDSTSSRDKDSPVNAMANNQAVTGMNTPVAHAAATGTTQSPMRASTPSRNPMTAQHRAAGHPAVTAQAQSNKAASAQGATKPDVPSPLSHSSQISNGSSAKATSDKADATVSANKAAAAKHVTSGGTSTGSTARGHANKAPSRRKARK